MKNLFLVRNSNKSSTADLRILLVTEFPKTRGLQRPLKIRDLILFIFVTSMARTLLGT